MMLTKNVGMTRQLSRKIISSFSFFSSSSSSTYFPLNFSFREISSFSSCQCSSLIDSSSASLGSFSSYPLFLSSFSPSSSSSSSSTWRRSPTYILLQQRIMSSSSSSSSSSSNKTKKEEKEKSKNQNKDNKDKDEKEKKKEVEEEDPFDEEALKRRAERMQKQAQIKRSNRLFWIVVFGVIFGSIAYEKQQEWADLEDERTRMNANAKLVLHAAGACINKNIPLEFSGRALRSTDDCGEDAFFIATSSFGVADGVGGWRSKGVDPSKISRQLMFNMNHFIEEDLRKQKEKGINSFLVKEHPKDLLEKAYKKIVSNSEVDAGSTTACIVSMAPSDDKTELNPVIRGANLGDSGFLVIRNGKEIFRSREQQQPGHFNAPLQLAIVPPRLGKGGSQPMFYSNQPSEAESISLISNPGDIIVMGTDGLFDNMFDSQIVDVVNRSFERERLSTLGQAGKSSAALSGDIWIPEQSHCRKVAEDVVLKAKENSLNTRWYSPYAQKARAAGDLKTGLGGKTDDITVVIGFVGGSATPKPPTTEVTPTPAPVATATATPKK